MKPEPEQLRALLEDVMPAEGTQCGPGRAAVLALVRQQQARRTRHRVLLTTAALVLPALLLPLLWQPAPPPLPAPVTQTFTPGPSAPPERIHQVNDQQLLDLLSDTDTPAALMEWPNGERTLLVWGR